jgi:predicted dehydrogenase
MNAKYKVVIIGCGARGQAHFNAYKSISDAEVTGCYDLNQNRLKEFAEKNGITPYSTPLSMLVKEKPDMVHIVTPVPGKLELMKLVSDNDVPLCTIEKPVALGVKDWAAISDLANKTNTRFAVCHQLRWHPFLQKCRQAINSGNIGELNFIHASAGMNPAVQGTHLLSYARYLNDESPIVRVFANTSGMSNEIPFHSAPDESCAMVEFKNGCRALWECGASGLVCEGSEPWMHVRLHAFATHGAALFEEFGNWKISGAPECELEGHFGGSECWEINNDLAQVGFHKAMLDWLQKEVAPGCNLQAALHEWKCILAMYASSVEKRCIDVTSFIPQEDIIEKLNSL